MLVFLASSLALLYTVAAANPPIHLLSDDFIELINSKQTTWKAGRNFPAGTTLEQIKMRLGLKLHRYQDLQLPVRRHKIDVLPAYFDSREQWPNCPSLQEIRDQGCCGNSWAFGAVAAMTDRMCIHSNGTTQFHFSAQDLSSCYFEYGSSCEGEEVYNGPWGYWAENGIVSGGGYNSNEGCRPYEIPSDPTEIPCLHHNMLPDCIHKCRGGYNENYDNDKRYGERPYYVKTGYDFMAEVYYHGPIEVEFGVYEDFINYKSGVYQYTAGEYLHTGAVKLLGWGKEDGTKYWLCANSYGRSWGDNGFFKILRGTNECDIELFGVAGEPILD